MQDIFENIIDKLEKEKETIFSNGEIHKSPLAVMRIYKAQEIVKNAEKEYQDMYLSTQKGLLKRIADYFCQEYTGDDKTAPKMELSVQELRYIAGLHVEKCKLEEKLRNIEKKKITKETSEDTVNIQFAVADMVEFPKNTTPEEIDKYFSQNYPHQDYIWCEEDEFLFGDF